MNGGILIKLIITDELMVIPCSNMVEICHWWQV